MFRRITKLTNTSPAMKLVAGLGLALLGAAPSWGAVSWHASPTLTATIRQPCSFVCNRAGKVPVRSITSKGTTYFVCRGSSGGETNRPGYQRSKYPYDRVCRVDHNVGNPANPFDCLCTD
jgi:hypothetical protein